MKQIRGAAAAPHTPPGAPPSEPSRNVPAGTVQPPQPAAAGRAAGRGASPEAGRKRKKEKKEKRSKKERRERKDGKHERKHKRPRRSGGGRQTTAVGWAARGALMSPGLASLGSRSSASTDSDDGGDARRGRLDNQGRGGSLSSPSSHLDV